MARSSPYLHPFVCLGWELRLVIDGGDLRSSQVVRLNDEILALTEQWEGAMVGRGWA